MKSVLKTRKTALAAAVAMALSAPAMAQTTPQLQIDQRYELTDPEFAGRFFGDIDILQTSTNFLGLGVYDITDDIDDYSLTRIARLNLGLDANGQATVGSTQFGSQQFLTIGLGAIGPSVASALNVSSTSTVVDQIIGGYAVVQQASENVALAFAGRSSTTNPGDAALRGLSQIGSNTANAAALNLTQGGALELTQQVYKLPGSFSNTTNADDLLRQNLGQSVLNIQIAATDQGEAVIDGANGTNLASRSTQFGTNVVNSALVASNAAIEIDLTQSLQSNGYENYGVGFPEQYASGYQSVISNTLLAQANNFSAGGPVDPAIRNMDQVAIFTGNALNVVNSGTTKLYGDGTEQNFTATYFDNTTTIAGGRIVEPVINSNRAFAINGEWEGDYGDGGFGDAMIDKLGQTIVTAINSVSVSGPSTTTTTNGVSTTTTAAAGLTRVGGVDASGLGVETFNQRVSGLRISPFYTDGPELYTALSYAYALPDEFIAPYALDFAPLQRYGTGNIAFAFTGLGIAAATNLEQLQSVTVNSFSTNGALAGAMIDPATLASLGLDGDLLAEFGGPSLLQQINAGSQFRTDVELQNLAAAVTECCGTARVSGSQTLATSLNSLSASGAVSGVFQQQVNGRAEVTLNNTMLAFSPGTATVGDFPVNGVMTSSPVAQTVVSSINTMSLGSVGTARIDQLINSSYDGNVGLLQSSANFAVALGSTATASNISQTVLNKLNTISAINPTPSQ